MFQFRQDQLLHAPLEEVWQFIAHPANLNKITPPEMEFTILTEVPERMYNGLLIEYEVTLPLLGKSPWVTEIKHIVANRRFVDEQRVGPYRIWYHYHGLEKTEDGVLMTDRVSYLPPFGILGKAANALFIRRNLEEIFSYRYETMEQTFNNN